MTEGRRLEGRRRPVLADDVADMAAAIAAAAAADRTADTLEVARLLAEALNRSGRHDARVAHLSEPFAEHPDRTRSGSGKAGAEAHVVIFGDVAVDPCHRRLDPEGPLVAVVSAHRLAAMWRRVQDPGAQDVPATGGRTADSSPDAERREWG